MLIVGVAAITLHFCRAVCGVRVQFFEHMPGSPGRSVKGSSSTSSACWGSGALASLGHGRQTLHIIGSRAAAATGAELSAPEPWVSEHC